MKIKRQEGLMLVEALLAVVLLAIGLLGTIGLQARAYSALSDAGMRAEATIAADKLLGFMATDQANLADYEVAEGAAPGGPLAAWHAETVGRIPGALISVDVEPVAGTTRSRVDIRIKWQRKAGDQQGRHSITSYISAST